MPTARASKVFAAGLGLRVRMGVALFLNGVLVAVLVLAAAVVTIKGAWAVVVMFALIALAGAVGGRGERTRLRRMNEHEARVGEQVERVLTRLSMSADMPPPASELIADGAPLSWTTALPFGKPRVHVTTGMASLLPDAELEAVLAHELSHIGNRDAAVMTVLAAPGVFVLRGLRAAWNQPDSGLREKAGLVMFACLYAPPAVISAGLSRIVSRHRELAADRGAALMTGSPAALASALARLSDGLHAIPEKDLRVAAAGDVLHVVPARPAKGITRLWATHPPLEDRIEQLERLETRLQA